MEPDRESLSAVQDRDLEDRVRNYLLGYKMPALREISVEASDETVTLQGRVSSFYQKQLCLHCCHRVAGVRTIIDEIAVEPCSRGERLAGQSGPAVSRLPEGSEVPA
jgi:osmotically-inducible protein OsmY